MRWIDVDGAYFNGQGPANSFTVFFYADNDGFPGNQVYASLSPWTQNGSTFRIMYATATLLASPPYIPANIGSRSKPT